MNKTQAVNEFLTAVFERTLMVDLKQMLSQTHGLDFGIISLVCSGIELIGALDHGRLEPSKRRFKEALASGKYFPDRYADYKETLYRRFRCGLAHQAFIKPGTATARNPEYRQYHLWGVVVEGEEFLFIHPDVFAEDFFQAFESFCDSLNADPQKIETAYCTISEIYREYQNTDEPIELHLSLPDDGLDITRMPLPKWMTRSEVSAGSIELTGEKDNT